MRERNENRSHNRSKTHFSDENMMRTVSMMRTAQNIYDWTVKAEERRNLIEVGLIRKQFTEM